MQTNPRACQGSHGPAMARISIDNGGERRSHAVGLIRAQHDAVNRALLEHAGGRRQGETRWARGRGHDSPTFVRRVRGAAL